MKEEAAAAGGCRGTFAPKACRSRRARQVATRHAIGQEAGNPPRSWVKSRKKGLHFHPRECVNDGSLMQALVARRALPAGPKLCPNPAHTPPVWILMSLGWVRTNQKK